MPPAQSHPPPAPHLPPGTPQTTAHPKIQWDQRGKWERRQRLLRGERSRDPSLPQAASQQGENFSSRKMPHFTPEMPRGSALTSTDLQPHHGRNSEHVEIESTQRYTLSIPQTTQATLTTGTIFRN